MIKSYESCRDCYFGAMNKYCSTGDCYSCSQRAQKEIVQDSLLCKCNTIEPGAECPWYKEVTDGTT